MASPSELTEVEVKRGYWFYAGTVRKTVMIFRLNYDFYYELEKSDGFDISDELPELNAEGCTYLLRWPIEGFSVQSGSFSVLHGSQALSLEGAIERAEQIVRQPIEWTT